MMVQFFNLICLASQIAGATILRRLEVEHPAAKVLVELAELQDSEVGDGTTSVVIIAAELLKRGIELVKNGIHPTTIMTGFRTALKETVKYIKSSLMVPIDDVSDDVVFSAAKTSMASKLLNADDEFWSKLAVSAVRSVKTSSSSVSSNFCSVGATLTTGIQRMGKLDTRSQRFIY